MISWKRRNKQKIPLNQRWQGRPKQDPNRCLLPFFIVYDEAILRKYKWTLKMWLWTDPKSKTF